MTKDIERAIIAVCAARGSGRTACPSEVARQLASAEDTWRALMPEVRRIAARLQAEDRLVVTQRGRPVDPASVRGPIRLALPQADLVEPARRQRSEQ